VQCLGNVVGHGDESISILLARVAIAKAAPAIRIIIRMEGSFDQWLFYEMWNTSGYLTKMLLASRAMEAATG